MKSKSPHTWDDGTALPVWNLVEQGPNTCLGLIILLPTGVKWTNQAGGMACCHPMAEGIFLPLSEAKFPHIGCWHDTVEPAEIEGALAATGWPVVYDESRAAEAMEGWWPVIVKEDAGDKYDAIFHFRGAKAILTTDNCD